MGEVYPAREARLDRNFPLWRRKPDWTFWSCSTPTETRIIWFNMRGTSTKGAKSCCQIRPCDGSSRESAETTRWRSTLPDESRQDASPPLVSSTRLVSSRVPQHFTSHLYLSLRLSPAS